MTPEERDLIAGLAERLRTADKNPKDREAEQFIRDIVAQQPSAPYLLVQTVLVQEHALTNAQTRIAALERQIAELSRGRGEAEAPSSGGVGSFLSGLLGRPQTPSSPTPSSASASAPSPRPAGGAPVPPPVPRQYAGDPSQAAPAPQPQYPSTMNMPPSAGGGFLRGALATAAGVAGGAMLFQGLQGLMGGHNSGPFGGGGFGGGGFGGFGGAGHLAGGGQPIETGSHDVINNYYGDTGGGSHGSTSGAGTEEDAERHSDMLRQSSEPVDDGGGDYRAAELEDSGHDDVSSGSDDLFADSGGGDSYDSGGDSGDFV